jgi:inositol oxygenase
MSELLEKSNVDELTKSIKDKSLFRNYNDGDRQDTVRNHYMQMRKNQTYDFVKQMHKKYSFETPRASMTIKKVFDELKSYIDSSDPDVSLPNLVHMLQTAEGIRNAGHPDWFQVNLGGGSCFLEYVHIPYMFS